MCGIAGIFDIAGTSTIDRSVVGRMSDSISHRGPDGGWTLGRPAAEITVADIIRVLEGPLASVRGIRPDQLASEGVELRTPPRAVSLPDDLLIPYSPPLEDAIVPSVETIFEAASTLAHS